MTNQAQAAGRVPLVEFRVRFEDTDSAPRLVERFLRAFESVVVSTVIDDYWKPISKEQLARREAGEPLTHRLVRLAHVSKRTERLLGPLQGLLLDG